MTVIIKKEQCYNFNCILLIIKFIHKQNLYVENFNLYIERNNIKFSIIYFF